MHTTDPTSARRSESEEAEHLVLKEGVETGKGKPWGSHRQEMVGKGGGEVTKTEDQ